MRALHLCSSHTHTHTHTNLQVGLQGAHISDGPVPDALSQLAVLLWDEHYSLGGDVPHSVQNGTPYLPGLPPPVIALVGAEHLWCVYVFMWVSEVRRCALFDIQINGLKCRCTQAPHPRSTLLLNCVRLGYDHNKNQAEGQDNSAYGKHTCIVKAKT
jgi:hypothetical protein